MRNSCICETKGTDQLHGNRTADQRLCFCQIDNTIPLLPNPKFQASSHLLWFVSGLVGNPKDRFCHDAAQK